MLLIYAIRQGYGYATAEKDLIKQYEFMLRLFQNARRRLDNTDDPQERRQILQALGGAALGEHAKWILMHPDRAINQGEIWRMGSQVRGKAGGAVEHPQSGPLARSLVARRHLSGPAPDNPWLFRNKSSGAFNLLT